MEPKVIKLNIKCCICGKEVERTSFRQKYCLECKAKVRKQKMKLYDKNRDPRKEKVNRINSNIKRNEVRAERKKLGLCVECGKPTERPIIRCNRCNEISKRSSIGYNRKRGMCESGKSAPQKIITEFIKGLGYDVIENDRNTIYSPLTDKPLELDIYIPSRKLAFEVDGPMHRKPVYGKERLTAQIINDRLTDEQCLEHNIKLVRINTDDITSPLSNDITNLITMAILNQAV